MRTSSPVVSDRGATGSSRITLATGKVSGTVVQHGACMNVSNDKEGVPNKKQSNKEEDKEGGREVMIKGDGALRGAPTL